LRQYKIITKTTLKDTSLKSHYKPAVETLFKDMERWIAEAKVAATSFVIDFGEKEETIEDLDPKERFALERFSDVLLEKGALVPLSKK
jgi:ribosomal biogenesis protein LAS1